MPLLTWELWLAKDIVEEDHFLRHLPEKNLSPGRVTQLMLGLLVEIGSPAKTPKPLEKFTGWKTGKESTIRIG